MAISSSQAVITHDALYKHALESIFVFLPIRDIALSVVAVSRRWNETIAGDTSTMRCLDAKIVKRRQLSIDTFYDDLCSSPVARRHVGSLGSAIRRVFIWDRHGPVLSLLKNLHTLYCRMQDNSHPDGLCFLGSLTSLDIDVYSHDLTNQMLQSVGLLPKLSRLTLCFPRYTTEKLVNFSPLQKSASLVQFGLKTVMPQSVGNFIHPEHIKQIRAMSQLKSFSCRLDTSNLREFLLVEEEEEKAIRWKSLMFVGEIDSLMASLVALSPLSHSLVRLQLHRANDLSFAHLLPNLTDLVLSDFRANPKESAWNGLPVPNNITVLTLEAGGGYLSSDHIERMVSSTPHLRTLGLSNARYVNSLAFLSHVRGTLTSLALHRCTGLRAIELEHIFALRQLTSLTLGRDSFGETLDSLTLSHLRVPSRYIPTLARFDQPQQLENQDE